MTNSGGDLMNDFLDARTRPLLGTQVDSNWYSTCFHGLLFSHHTKCGEFLAKGNSKRLIDKYGSDNLEIQVDFSHKNDLEVFWSLRMNDAHDSYPPGTRPWSSQDLASFKREHPEYMMGELDDWYKYPDGPRPCRHWL